VALHRTLVPAVAFAVTLGLAAWMTSGARDDPRTALHRAVTAYHRALERGDLEGVAKFVPDDARRPRETHEVRVQAWKGTAEWAVAGLELGADGSTGTVALQRRLRGAGPAAVVVVERESWRREGEGAWGILDWEEVRRGTVGGVGGPRVELPPGGR
jgi:hypothetical protein